MTCAAHILMLGMKAIVYIKSYCWQPSVKETFGKTELEICLHLYGLNYFRRSLEPNIPAIEFEGMKISYFVIKSNIVSNCKRIIDDKK